MRLGVDVGDHRAEHGGVFLLAFQAADLLRSSSNSTRNSTTLWLRSFTSGSTDSDGGVFSVMVPSSKLCLQFA